jgi:hypothetical protein
MRWRVIGLVILAGALVPERAAAGEVVLFFCEDGVLGEGECASLLAAFREEVADHELEVHEGSIEEKLAQGMKLPPAVVSVTRDSAAIAAVWIEGGESVSINVYIPESLQTISKIMAEGQELDHRDVAFRLRTLLGAALYSDLPEFEVEEESEPEPEEAPVAPMPRIERDLEPPMDVEPRERRTWVRLQPGYVYLGYPTKGYWYHGVAFRVGVLALPALEIFLDADITAPKSMRFEAGIQRIRLENSQYVVGLGASYTFRIVGPVELTPLAGFHLGVSDSKVEAGGVERHRQVNTAIWAGLELRISIVRWMSLVVSTSMENLFNYEYFEWNTHEGEERVFSLNQFRMNVIAGACVSL